MSIATRRQALEFGFVRVTTRRTARRPAAKSGGPRGQHHGRAAASGPSYKPGDPVPQSGIYEVVHARGHRTPHEVVMLSGDAFPACDTCDQSVRFRLLRTAPYIFQDEDFEEQ